MKYGGSGKVRSRMRLARKGLKLRPRLEGKSMLRDQIYIVEEVRNYRNIHGEDDGDVLLKGENGGKIHVPQGLLDRDFKQVRDS